MAANLNVLGTNAAYNGFAFTPFLEMIEFVQVPIKDSSGRTIVATEYTISLRDVIVNATPGNTIDATIASARQKLMAIGGALTLVNRGFGDLQVNTGSARTDVMWGPVPQRFTYKPKGRDQAGEITWTVKVVVPDQCVSPAYQFKLMEACFTVEYVEDRSGYTTRTFAGFLKIPSIRSGQTLSDNADNYREKIALALIPGFRRIPGTFKLDESKCRLDFTIVDEEMPPAAPPPGIIEVDASHEVETGQPVGSWTTQWIGRISGTYEVARTVPRVKALQYFLDLINSRIGYARSNATAAGAVLVKGFRMSEPEINGRKAAAFACTYTFTSSLATILGASGLWTSPPNSNWQIWAASLTGALSTALNVRGNAGLKFQNADDLIINLCQPNQQIPLATTSQLTTFPGFGQAQLRNAYPPLDHSYLDYQMHVKIETEDNIVELKTLPQTAQLVTQPGQGPPQVNESGTAQLRTITLDQLNQNFSAKLQVENLQGSYVSPYPPGSTGSVVQQRCGPYLTLTLQGSAIRAGWAVPCPFLLSIGNLPVVPQNMPGRNGYVSGIVASWFGVPIVLAYWSLRYIVPGIPSTDIGLPIPALVG